jgi:hypothetical protein
MAATIGHLVDAAERAGDRRALAVAGGAVTATCAVGATVMPRSGFLAGLATGLWLLRRAGSRQPRSA